jgi:hypothetical protein
MRSRFIEEPGTEDPGGGFEEMAKSPLGEYSINNTVIVS